MNRFEKIATIGDMISALKANPKDFLLAKGFESIPTATSMAASHFAPKIVARVAGIPRTPKTFMDHIKHLVLKSKILPSKLHRKLLGSYGYFNTPFSMSAADSVGSIGGEQAGSYIQKMIAERLLAK